VYVSNSSTASVNSFTFNEGSKFVASSGGINYNFYAVAENIVYPGQSIGIEVREGTQVFNETLVSSSSGLPNQNYLLANSDADLSTIGVSVTEEGVETNWVRYETVQDIPQNSRGFSVLLAASGKVQINFGNRINGFIPPAGSTVTTSYTRSSGANGNIGSGLINTIVSTTPSYISINQSETTAATGGTNGETAETLKSNITSYMRTQDRAVTLKDYEDLTRAVNGVYKAVATYTPGSGSASGGASVTLYGLPYVSNFLTLEATNVYSISVPSSLQTAITDRISPRSMLGVTPIAATSITLAKLNIVASVYVSDGFVNSAVANNVNNAIDGLLSFDNTDFGKQIRRSDIYRAVMAIRGVDYIEISDFKIRNSVGAEVTVLDPTHLIRKGSISLTFSGGMVVS
jgi:predicted phage baseplate assembly protein